MMNFTKTMLLKKLIKISNKDLNNINIKGLATNNSDIKQGYIFFAIKGNKTNGENYIGDAVKNGAEVIVCSKNCKYKNKKILIIKTDNIRKYLSNISSKFYNYKLKKFNSSHRNKWKNFCS